MKKYTPGPWMWHFRNDEEAPGTVVAVGFPNHTDRPYAVAMCPRYGREDWAANARLIAAAPDLLEACRVFAEWLRREDDGPEYPAGTDRDSPGGDMIWQAWYYGNIDLCDRAQVLVRAAIAKAEGREP